MLTITFADRDTEKRALAVLIGRFSGQVMHNGEHLVPSEALEVLAQYNIPFLEGKYRTTRGGVDKEPNSVFTVLDQWREYHCDEYFCDGWAAHGYLDQPSQTWVIVPVTEAYELAEFEFLAVGCSGWGGIDFGYRKKHLGLWAFYPIDREFKFMAATVAELVNGWCSSRLSV